MAKPTLVTRGQWDLIRQRADLPEDADPSHYGFMLYWSTDRIDLLKRLQDHWS